MAISLKSWHALSPSNSYEKSRKRPPLFISTNPTHLNLLHLRDLFFSANHSCNRFPRLDAHGRVEPVDLRKIQIAVQHSSVVVSVFCRREMVDPDSRIRALLGRAVPVSESNGQLVGFGRAVSDCGLTASIYDVAELMESGTCDPLRSIDENLEACYRPKTAPLKAIAILASATAGVVAVAICHSWVAANQDIAMVVLFALGYAGIIFEESLAFNKSGVALLMAVSLWVIRSIGAPSTNIAVAELNHASAEVSELVFFLLGGMTIVKMVDAHQGFKLVTDNIPIRKRQTLLWVVGFVTFFLSSIIDNLTSTIIMVSLLHTLLPNPSEYRKILGAVVVIAANAGGAWTPTGDVTTTMLWMHGQISTFGTMKGLFIPSALSMVVPLALMSLKSEVRRGSDHSPHVFASEEMAPRGKLVFAAGIFALVFVPVFKAITGLPPYMGMLLGLGVLWILTDAIHYGESSRQMLKVPHALSKIDAQAVLFFLGTLLSVSSLGAAGILRELGNYLDAHIPNIELIASAIGVFSAIIDNIPLVGVTMGMYDISLFPQDAEFWQLIAYCTGTGGSLLIIGSAAGVAFMGMEKVGFFWYLRKVSVFAFAGYVTGFVTCLALHRLRISLPGTLAQVLLLSSS